MGKKILVICGTGVATSTVVMTKLRDFLKEKGIAATLKQAKVADVLTSAADYDLIISTTIVPASITSQVHVIDAVPLLTGFGREKVYEEIERALQ